MLTRHKHYHDFPEYPEFTCEVCGEELVMTDKPGQWTCESEEKHYLEINNITKCTSTNCPNQILTENSSFTKPEQQYCDEVSETKELYIQDGYGYEYEDMSCLEYYQKGIRKNRDKKGIYLTCIECDSQFLMKGDGHLLCRNCGSEIDGNTSLFLAPIFTPESFNDNVKKVKIQDIGEEQ